MQFRTRLTTGLAATLCLLSAFIVPVEAQDGKTPDIEILERVHDAGEIMKGEKIDYAFKIKNKGSAPLQIFDVRPSCGCTVASFDKTILPGKIGKVEATIDTNRVGNGPQTKTITVQSNDPDEGTIVLQLKSNVITLASAIPPNVYVRTDRTAMQGTSFLLRPHESNQFKVKAVTSDLPFLKFDVKAVEANEDESSKKPTAQRERIGDYRIEVSYAKNAPVGDLNGLVTVLTDSSKTPEVKVPIRGTITGLITTVPRRVYLRVQEPKVSLVATETVKLRRNPSIQSPEVGEVKKDAALEELPKPANLDPGNEWVRVRTPERQVGYVFRRFTKEGDTKSAAPVVNQTRTVQVRKPDGTPFKISNATIDIEGVSIKTSTVETGRSYSVTLTYDGKLEKGSHNGEMVITTTDKDEPTLKIPVYVHIT